MIENSRFRVWNSQRAADGGIAVRTPELNGLMRAGRTVPICRRFESTQ